MNPTPPSPLFEPITIEGEVFVSLPDQIRQNAKQNPNMVALCDGDLSLTWAEFLSQLESMGKCLVAMGVRPDDKVGIMGDLQGETMMAYVAILFAGACTVPLPGIASDAALSGMIGDCGAKVILTTNAARARTESLLASDPAYGDIRLAALDFEPNGKPIENLMPTAAGPEVALPDQNQKSLFNIIYSSGTTGVPKGIVHDNLYRFRQMERMKGTGINGSCTMFVTTAIYSNTTIMPALTAFAGGGTLVLLRKFSARAYVDTANKHGVTHAMLVPTLIQRLLAEPGFQSDSIPTLERTYVTASPFAPAVKAEAVARWPSVLQEIYGMTEGGLTTMLDTSKHGHKLDSVGLPSPSATIRVIDPEGVELPIGEIGEIIGHSNTMMNGYHNRPEQNAKVRIVMPDGLAYFRTGDLGRFDSDGFLYVVGRAKDVIISGGFNIYATDLEDALLSHPEVSEASVMGAPSEKWGETPVAAVVLVADAKTKPEDLIAFANAKLGKAQRIAALKTVDRLPLNALGKVVKAELAKMLSDLSPP